MFKFGHPDPDSSFIFVSAEDTLAQVHIHFKEFQYVIVKHGDYYYVIETAWQPFFAQWDSSGSILSTLISVDWTPSLVVKMNDIANVTDWRRPLIITDYKGHIRGILSPETLLRFLINENTQLSAYFYTLAETVSDAVSAVNKDGEVICWNTAAEKTYGIPREEILGEKIGEHFKKESLMLHRILDEGRPVRQAYHRPTPETHVLINASPIIENNQVIGGIATEHDITSIVRLNEELYSSIARLDQEHPFSSIIGLGRTMKHSLQTAKKIAKMNTPVLLIGEAGTGKEMVAQAIHYNSPRKDESFFSLNCGALPPGLLETELFGYQGGAFSGDDHLGKPGKLESASNGTVYLEEIHLMAKEIQIKLARFLKDKSFCRVGSSTSLASNTRIVASCPNDLRDKLESGEFDEELFYQLNILSIEIPPLRERPEDIPELVQSFMKEFSTLYQKPMMKIDPSTMVALMNYHWPGNVRELRNVIERAVILNETESISLEDLPKPLSEIISGETIEEASTEVVLKAKVTEQEEALIIEEALRKTYGNKSAAAKLLGISRGTLYNKMKEYGL